jgi:hypothetical protein
MLIDKLLGLSIKDLKAAKEENVIAINNVNSTVELKNVTSTFDDGEHHALFFFDLADNTFMTMAVVKFEGLDFKERWRIRRMRNIQCQGYIDW